MSREDRLDQLQPSPGPQRGGVETGPSAGTLALPTGVVLATHRGGCEVRMPDDTVRRCSIRRTTRSPAPNCEPPVVVGDTVRVSAPQQGEGSVEHVEPRRTQLDRAHPSDERRGTPRRQVLVANPDLCVLVCALEDPPLRPGLIDRFLVGTACANLPVLLVFNKCDLVPDETEVERVYRGLGVTCLRTSAERGDGVEALRAALAGKRAVLTGHSGVGKSSLLAALDPDIAVWVSDVNPVTGRGRHTTSNARLYRLAGGIELVDAPGIREFEPTAIDRGTLAAWFPELLRAAASCHFTPCSHTHEPDCAVKDGIGRGEIAQFRVDSYTRLLATAR